MQSTSSTAVFTSLTRTFKRFRQEDDVKGLQRLMASDAFWDDLRVLRIDHRQTVLSVSNTLLVELKERIGPLLPMANNKTPKWNEVQIARLRSLDAKYGDDELIARALRLPLEATARARLRYVGKREKVAKATAGAVQAA